PRTAALLPLWSGADGSPAVFPAWNTLSLTPSATRIALAVLLGYVMLFCTAVGRLRSIADVQRLLRWIATAAVAMAVFGLVQYFTSNGLFFWFYDYPYSDTERGVKGSFSCRNHFGHFLVLGFAPLAASVMYALVNKDVRSNTHAFATSWLHNRNLQIGCLALVAFAVFLSLSRGAALTLAVSASMVCFIYWQRGLVARRTMWSLAGLAMIVLGMLSIYGFDS